MKSMKMFVGLLVLFVSTQAFSQGSLTPPGAPGATMKTLDQIEPRTPISGSTNITQSGSYYLTGDVTVSSGHGIMISADEVTLDLNGFTIESTASGVSSDYGIYVNGTRRDITIVNGFVKSGTTWNGTSFSGAGFNCAIYSSSDSNISVSEVSVDGCYYGINLDNSKSTSVAFCTVRTCAGGGIVAGRVESSIALECGYGAIDADQVTNCRGECVYDGYGIIAITVRGSYGRTADGSYGIYATAVHDSYGSASSSSSSAIGILASTVLNSYGDGYSSASDATGISGVTINNCYGSAYCTDTGTGTGIDASAVHNSYGYCWGDNNGAGLGIDAYAVGNSYGFSSRSNSGSRGIVADGPVADSYAVCSPGYAIVAKSAKNCYGSGSTGIDATVVNGCYGLGTSSYGVLGKTINNSYGESTSGYGIYGWTVNNSYGKSSSSYGLDAAASAQNSYGITTSGAYGLNASSIAIGCYGHNSGSGIGIYGGTLLNSCSGYSVSGTAVLSSHKYNMP